MLSNHLLLFLERNVASEWPKSLGAMGTVGKGNLVYEFAQKPLGGKLQRAVALGMDYLPEVMCQLNEQVRIVVGCVVHHQEA